MPALQTPRRADTCLNSPGSPHNTFPSFEELLSRPEGSTCQESDNLSAILASAIRVHEKVRDKSLHLEVENKRLREEISHIRQRSCSDFTQSMTPDTEPTTWTPTFGSDLKAGMNASISGSPDGPMTPQLGSDRNTGPDYKVASISKLSADSVGVPSEIIDRDGGLSVDPGCPSSSQHGKTPTCPVSANYSSTSAMELTDWQQDLVQIFHELDRDGSGTLSTEELRTALEVAGVPRARLAKLLRLADTNSSGEIDVTGWVSSVTKAITDSRSSQNDMRSFQDRLAEKRLEFGSIAAAVQYKTPDRAPCMLNPKSWERVSWDVLMSTFVLYISLALPFTVAWEDDMPSQTSDVLRNIDRIINYLFMLDIVLNFRTGFVDREGDLVMRSRRTAMHYLQTWFTLDVLSCFPFEEFEDIAFSGQSPTRGIKLLKSIKLLRVARLMRPRHFDPEDFSVVLEDIAQSKVFQIIHRRSTMITYTMLLCHWLACFMKIVDEGFLSSYDEVAGQRWSEYLAAIYWAMTTLTTVGYGDIIPTSDGERVFVTISIVVGGTYYGYVIGAIASLVQNSDLNTSAYYDKMDVLHEWLSKYRLPADVRRSVQRYFKHYLTDRLAINATDIWSELSPELKREVGGYFIHEDVKNNPLFDGLSIGSVVRMQAILQRITISPGCKVTESGEVGTAMYFIVSGTVSLCRVGKEEQKLGPGESFGEEVLLGFEENYEYTVTVVERAKLELILEGEFLQLFSTMPNELERMRQNAKAILSGQKPPSSGRVSMF